MPEHKSKYQCRALLLGIGMGAGEAGGGRCGKGAGEVNAGGKPPASCPSPPASQTKEATGSNPEATMD